MHIYTISLVLLLAAALAHGNVVKSADVLDDNLYGLEVYGEDYAKDLVISSSKIEAAMENLKRFQTSMSLTTLMIHIYHIIFAALEFTCFKFDKSSCQKGMWKTTLKIGQVGKIPVTLF